MRFVVVDDEEYNREEIPKIIAETFPDALVRTFEELYDANSTAFDVLVIDISSICPVMLSHSAYSPICMVLDSHPGCTVIINSCVARETMEMVREDILERKPDASVLLAGFPFSTTLPKALESLKTEQAG